MALKLAGQSDNSANNTHSAQNDTFTSNTDGGTNVNKIADDPWEYEGVKKVRSIADTLDNDVYSTSNTATSGKISGDKNIIVTISGIILYVLIALAVAAFAWMTVSGKPVDIYFNIKKVQPLFSFLSLYAIIDSILVFVMVEKRVSLIIFAVILQPFYPLQRNKVINGYAGIGGLVTLAYVVGIIAMIGAVFKGVSTYGNVIRVEDPTVRRDIVVMFNQTMDNGNTYGKLITKYLQIEDAAMNESGGQTLIALTGKGNVSVADEGVFEIGEYNVNTALVFSRDVSGDYNIVSVQLGDKMLTTAGAQSYWHAIKTY